MRPDSALHLNRGCVGEGVLSRVSVRPRGPVGGGEVRNTQKWLIMGDEWRS